MGNLRENILAIQRYLRTLHLVDPRIPLINVDGIYDKETETAVLAFQQKNGLPETGEVDFATWEMLRNEAEISAKLLRAPSSLLIFDVGDLPLQPGRYSGEVYLLQALINALSLRYDNISRIDVTGEYDVPTAAQVARLQQILGLEETGILDLLLWEKLTALWK